MFRIRERFTTAESTAAQRNVGLERASGTWRTIQDNEMIEILNPLADRPRSPFFDTQPTGDVKALSFLTDAASKIAKVLPDLDTGMETPVAELYACLLPGAANVSSSDPSMKPPRVHRRPT